MRSFSLLRTSDKIFIIFLDVDGVLIKEFTKSIDKHALQNLKNLMAFIEAYGYKPLIVFSSNWRKGNALKKLKTYFSDLEPYIYGKTPEETFSLEFTGTEQRKLPRSIEIGAWLKEHENLNIQHFIILDDNDDFISPIYKHHFVNCKIGFFDEAALVKAKVIVRWGKVELEKEKVFSSEMKISVLQEKKCNLPDQKGYPLTLALNLGGNVRYNTISFFGKYGQGFSNKVIKNIIEYEDEELATKTCSENCSLM